MAHINSQRKLSLCKREKGSVLAMHIRQIIGELI